MASPGDTRCPSCGRDAPPGNYCALCGALLSPPTADRGRHFAAAPHQHLLVPSIPATLFPHLPRAGHDTFRALLVAGVLLVGALALAGLFPLALIVAAVLVPLLVLIYIHEVDLYEHEPLRVLTLTIAWGAASGVGLGFLREATAGAGAVLESQTTAHAVLWNGVLLPLIGLVAALAGPLALLRQRRFNDVLDGVTFGAASAVTFASAELLTHSSVFLAAGFAPSGLVTPWTLRLLTLAIAVPVLAAAAVGATAGSFWLRVRGRIAERRAHRLLAQPVLALGLAAALLVGAALLQLYVGRWGALGALAALDAVALVWLRLLLHVGLLEELAEQPGAAASHCPNCGRPSPRLSFCSYCGVAMRALPKSGRGHGRRERRRVVARFASAVALLVGLAVVAMAAAEPGPVQSACPPSRACTNPPRLVAGPSPASTKEVLRNWTSAGGLRLTYDARRWQPRIVGPHEIELVLGEQLALDVQAGRSGAPPQERAADQLGFFQQRYPDLGVDAAHPLAAAAIGSVPAAGNLYAGHDAVDGRPVEVLIEAATRGPLSVLVTAWTSQEPHTSTVGATTPFDALVNADAVLETLSWPSGLSR